MLKKNFRQIMVLVLLVHSASLIGCTRTEKLPAKKYSETRMLMGTIVGLDVCRDEQNMSRIDAAYKEAWERLEDISWRMNVLDERSDVAKVNNSSLAPVSVGADTYHVLKESIYFFYATHGTFDITVWPLIQLWREGEKNNVLPTREQMKAVQKAVGLGNIQLLANNRVKLHNKDTKVDLGGIAKGYAIDEVARIFRKHGIVSFFIDAGGDVYVGGHNCSGEPWRIGIRDPRDKSRLIDIVHVVDSAVATSGNYEQYYEIQNERWSHIMNPITGYPQKDVISATVIAKSAIEADALATAVCVLGAAPGTEYINSLKDQYASLIIVRQESGDIKKFTSHKYEKFRVKR